MNNVLPIPQRHLVFSPRRDRDLSTILRDRDVRFSVPEETETLLGRDRDFFLDLLACAIMASF